MFTQEVNLGGVLPFSSARAQAIAKKAAGFESKIILTDQRGTFNGKSLLGLLSLGKLSGSRLTLQADGPDEEEAVRVLAFMLEAANDDVLSL